MLSTYQQFNVLCCGSGWWVSRVTAAMKALSASRVKHCRKSCCELRGNRRDPSPSRMGKVVGLDCLVQHRPSDQKVPSWNLITTTVSRLNSKLCTVIWRPSVQGLTESPVIRNASYYHSPKSYLNRSLMWLWFPRTICCYCSSALLWVRETNQSCFQITWRGGTGKQWSWSDIQLPTNVNSPNINISLLTRAGLFLLQENKSVYFLQADTFPEFFSLFQVATKISCWRGT